MRAFRGRAVLCSACFRRRLQPGLSGAAVEAQWFRGAAVAAAGVGFAWSKRPAQLETEPPGVSVSSSFDSGNIELVESRGTVTDLKIRKDPFTKGTDEKSHSQWFHFRASGVRGKECTFRIVNAGECSYAPGWNGYRACCSYDHQTWFRVPTAYDEKEGVLTIKTSSSQDTLWCAYFAPFSYESHQQLIANCSQKPGARVKSIGKTLDGRDLDLVTAGKGKLRIWITARQHPGESMAEHWAEGFLDRLLDPHDAKSSRLKELCTFYVVPNANPDGSVRGYLRTNASGANLNREWAPSGTYQAPSLERSPEVFYILREMENVGVDFLCDVHGDEQMPHNFLAGVQGIPSWTNQHARLHQKLAESYQAANPDFGSLLYNYGNDELGQADMRCADSQVAERFGCLAVTLEQPFKDCFDRQEPNCGWSPARSRRLGASFLDALSAILPDLHRKFSVDPATLAPWARPGYACPAATECSWEANASMDKGRQLP
eukprot:TRINITY_DN113875_c0_g1_i1.p1 TRINITY_DN113875_c0_g1~~TRINITY_DN113875_c0_g1_i1.p1  ORF type:complete len:488 (+),score=56.34 TRINITY_DN113875_c0_g1_i1:69-1532(+)